MYMYMYMYMYIYIYTYVTRLYMWGLYFVCVMRFHKRGAPASGPGAWHEELEHCAKQTAITHQIRTEQQKHTNNETTRKHKEQSTKLNKRN